MADRLTQLQEAVDQLAHQMVACIYYVNKHHDLEKLKPDDAIRELKQEEIEKEGFIDPVAPEEFKAGQLELARDLIYKEQQIEYLISSLPGLDNNEADQARLARELEEDLKAAEAQRQEAIRERNEVLAQLDQVLRATRRP